MRAATTSRRSVRELTGGHGADIVFNTVGSPYFEAANKAMAKGATQIFIATIERAVPFDIFAFYRGMHTLRRHRHAGARLRGDRRAHRRAARRLRGRHAAALSVDAGAVVDLSRRAAGVPARDRRRRRSASCCTPERSEAP